MKKDQFSDSDDFWDLELLLPKTEKTVAKRQNYNVDTSDFNADIKLVRDEPKGEKIPPRAEGEYPPITQNVKKTSSFDAWLAERKEIERGRALAGKQMVESYAPDNPLIKNVTISIDGRFPRSNERFLADAERMYKAENEFKGNVPFESFFPHYSQMSKEQIECYIGFRSLVRRGEYPDIDISYIYLYLYELIALSSQATPTERALSVCGLINGYPNANERLFSDMCNWLCDICLIYKVELPENIFGDNVTRVIESAALKEFFLPFERKTESGMGLILTSARYDYRKSKFYREHRAFYDKYIYAAVMSAVNVISKKDSRFLGSENDYCTLTHESYSGAVCTSAARRTISVECLCVTRSEAVKRTITELIKYSENKLRELLGIKPRLTVSELSLEYRELIKSYYRSVSNDFPPIVRSLRNEKQKTKEQGIPDYEKLYEPKEQGISFDEAARIEKMSWSLTEKLVTDDMTDDFELQEPEEYISKSENTEYSDSSDSIFREALSVLIKDGSAAFCVFAKENGYIPDALADEINDRMYDILSDIVIIIGDGYEPVTDYIDEINEFISGV